MHIYQVIIWKALEMDTMVYYVLIHSNIEIYTSIIYQSIHQKNIAYIYKQELT